MDLDRLVAEERAGRVDAIDADVVEHAAAHLALDADVVRHHRHGEGRGEEARLADAPGAGDLHRFEVGALEVQAVGNHQLRAAIASCIGH